MDKSHRPHSPHPNAHTEQEIKWIQNYIRRNPNITVGELWIKLKKNKGYKRHPGSLYRVFRRNGWKYKIVVNNTSKYTPKHYETPKYLGVKWQIDVKYVPKECLTDSVPKDIRYYQYTCIDEASRERFLYWYDIHSPENTVDFINKCIEYYGLNLKKFKLIMVLNLLGIRKK